MKNQFFLTIALLCCFNVAQALPVDQKTAKSVGEKFVRANFEAKSESPDLQLVYTGQSNRNETCFYVFNSGKEGFVIVSADDRFRPIVGYSDEGPFETENMSPELEFYLGKIIEARTSPEVVLFDDTEAEWQSVRSSGKLLSRNGGKGVDYICTTKWNQDSPYNLYAPEGSGGPGGRCYAGCVATAMSQVMKRWNHPLQGTGSHSYYCYGHGSLSANFGQTTYDWDNMPDRVTNGSLQEEIEAVALLMYHCAVAVDMSFSPTGSGANSWDVPDAINQYFSYSNQAELLTRDFYSLFMWQDKLKESFDIGWPVYYSGYSESAGHAFVCDGYDDSDLFHFNWGWGGSSDGWFVIDEIDYAGWAQAIFNYVPTDVYDYMPLRPENFEVVSLGDNDYSAVLSWTNPTHNIHGTALTNIDQIVVTREGKIVYTEDNVAPGADMTFTDHYLPTMVSYAVYAIVHNAPGLEAKETDVILGPTCTWHLEMTSSEDEGWNSAYISMQNSSGVEIGQLTCTSASTSRNVEMPLGHVGLYWYIPTQAIDKLSFEFTDAEGNTVLSFEGASSDMQKGLFFMVNNTCGSDRNHNAPKNLTATSNGSENLLSWGAAEGTVNHYFVYRDGVLLAVCDNTSYADGAFSDNMHTYYVTAVNDLGESDPSNLCNVQPEGACEAPRDLRYEMMANNKVKLIWDAPLGDTPTGYYLYRRSRGQDFKRIKSLTNTTYNDNLNAQPNEVYDYAIAAYYAASDCISDFANALGHPEMNLISVNKTCIPMNLDFLIMDGAVVLMWNNALMAETYNVYRDGELIATGLTYPTYTDSEVSSQVAYRYTVTGVTSFFESNHSNEVYVDWTTGLSESADSEEITVYPNPTTGKVSIEAQGISQVSVFNLMGQEVLREAAHANKVGLDLSALPKGSYFLKVVSEQGTITQKVTKL